MVNIILYYQSLNSCEQEFKSINTSVHINALSHYDVQRVILAITLHNDQANLTPSLTSIILSVGAWIILRHIITTYVLYIGNPLDCKSHVMFIVSHLLRSFSFNTYQRQLQRSEMKILFENYVLGQTMIEYSTFTVTRLPPSYTSQLPH